MVSHDAPYDRSSQSEVGSLQEKSRPHDKLDSDVTDEFDVYGDESHADSAYMLFCGGGSADDRCS